MSEEKISKMLWAARAIGVLMVVTGVLAAAKTLPVEVQHYAAIATAILGGLYGKIHSWLPVPTKKPPVLPVLLILLAQIGTRGLRPALEEEQRLIEHERVLLERLEADEASARDLYSLREAMSDDIFQERLRRLDQDELLIEIEERGLHLREPESGGSPEQASQ